MDYAAAANKALATLARNGQIVIMRVVTLGTYDPGTGTTSATVTADESRVGVMFDYPAIQYGSKTATGTVIEATDKQFYMDAVGGIPQPSDQVIIGGVTWNIISIKSLAPAGIAVLHELQLRK